MTATKTAKPALGFAATVLGLYLVQLQALDIASTYSLLHYVRGAHEANPIGAVMFSTIGFWPVAVFKLVGALVATYTWGRMGKAGLVMLTMLCVVYTLVVANNLVLWRLYA